MNYLIYDIHCHVLPGVDDGARNEESTERMLRMATKHRIGAIVATPHFSSEMSKEKTEEVKKKYQLVRDWWMEMNPKHEFYLGNELYYGEGVIDALDEGRALTMNGTRYVLVEFPTYAEYSYIYRAVQNFLYASYIPIIAHMERYEHLHKKAHVRELVEMGAYMQVNAATVTGKHGFFAKLRIVRLMKEGLIHFVGTDAHGARERRPEMRECVEYMIKKLGKKKARQILEKNPMAMLKGEEIDE